jgi:hypothetical protein
LSGFNCLKVRNHFGIRHSGEDLRLTRLRHSGEISKEHTPLRTETIRRSGERIEQSGEQFATLHATQARFFGINPRNDLRIGSVIYVQYVNEEQQQAAAVIFGMGE